MEPIEGQALGKLAAHLDGVDDLPRPIVFANGIAIGRCLCQMVDIHLMDRPEPDLLLTRHRASMGRSHPGRRLKDDDRPAVNSEMGIVRIVGSTAAGLGLVGVGLVGLGGEDNTTRDEAGAIVESGEVGAFRIRLGDCIDGLGLGEIESVEGVPCDSAHELEVYFAFNLPDGDGSYPGDEAVGLASEEECFDAFEPFVGLDYQESTFGFKSLTPTEASWNSIDDREVLCMIGNYDGTPKTGSARGSAI